MCQYARSVALHADVPSETSVIVPYRFHSISRVRDVARLGAVIVSDPAHNT